MNSWRFWINNDKLIIEGKKTATSSLYKYDKVPVIDKETIIHYDDEKEACVVKPIDYKIMDMT